MTILLWGQHYVLVNGHLKVVVHGCYLREEASLGKLHRQHIKSTANVAENHRFEVEVVAEADILLLTGDLKLNEAWRIPLHKYDQKERDMVLERDPCGWAEELPEGGRDPSQMES